MTQTIECPEARIALGVYVLGAIDPADRAVVDAHLTTCRDCRDELAGLAGLPALLSRVSAEEAFALAGVPAPVAAGRAESLREGVELSQRAIDSGAATAKLDEFTALTTELSPST